MKPVCNINNNGILATNNSDIIIKFLKTFILNEKFLLGLNNRKINEELNKIPTIFILVKATKVSYRIIINIKNKNDLFGILRNLFLVD